MSQKRICRDLRSFSDNKCPLFAHLGGGGSPKGDNDTFFYRFSYSAASLRIHALQTNDDDYDFCDYDDYDCDDYDYDDNIHLASSSSIPSLFPMVKEALGGENCQWLQNNQESKVRL